VNNKRSRARELLDHFTSTEDEDLNIPEEDRRALTAIVRLMNRCCSPPLEPGHLSFDDEAYYFFTIGRAYERLEALNA
jgi:hypothetical protein